VDDEWSWYDRNVVTVKYFNIHLTQVVKRKKDNSTIEVSSFYEKKGQIRTRTRSQQRGCTFSKQLY
jgi:hypothetical protein